MTWSGTEALASLMAALRRERRQQSGLAAELVPPDHDTAYRVADRAATLLGWEQAGWKIAATNPVMQQALRTTGPIRGRVWTPFVTHSPAEIPHAPLLHPISECEYVVKLAADLPPRGVPYTRAEVEAAIEWIAPAIEVAECRFVRDAAFPPLAAVLADGSGNGGLVLGEPIRDWRNRDIPGQKIALRTNGTQRREGSAAEALVDHPAVPVTWLANDLARFGMGLRAGEVVSTGTCTGMVLARAGEEHIGDFGAFGEIRIRYS